MMADATDASSLIQAHSLRIGQSSFLTVDRMVTPGGVHTGLIPAFPFAGGIAQAVQYGGNLVIAMANGHPTDNLKCLHRRHGFSCGTGPLYHQLRVRTALPVDYQFKSLSLCICPHNDLFDNRAEDHFLDGRSTVITLPDFSKVLAHQTYSG